MAHKNFRNIHTIIAALCSLILFSACNNTKHLPKGQTLYVGSEVDIKDKEGDKRTRQTLKEDLNDAIRPKPNKKFLGMRVKLSIYNIIDTVKKDKGFRHWLKYKVGEPPVTMSDVNIGYNEELLVNMLENRGYFYPEVDATTETKNRKTKLHFDVVTNDQYKIRNVIFPDSSSSYLEYWISTMKEKSLFKEGTPYNLDMIKDERERINNNLKELGYFFFLPDHILIRADTTVGTHQVDMKLLLKDNMPEKARQSYHINNIYIEPDYKLEEHIITEDSAIHTHHDDTVKYEWYHIVGYNNKYKPSIFKIPMQFKPGDPYKRSNQLAAVSRLVDMSVFKFVKNEFEEVDDTSQHLLDVYYHLTPFAKKTLQAELAAVSKNDSRVGSQINVSWKNRNTFKGAELLTVKANAGFETQYSGALRRPNTYQFGVEPSITIPRFVIPFVDPQTSSRFVPKTTILAGYDLLMRSKLYRLHSAKAGYGYTWKENLFKQHELFPINITYVHADTLNSDSASQINLSNLIFTGIIIGPTYEYIYNSRGNGEMHKHDYYFTGKLDLSGNLLGLAQGTSVDEAPKTILEAPYAQYTKLTTEIRHYMNYGINKNAIWANRFLVGVGVPYGNSYQLPNIKQFFSGGNSSLRGFRSRLVGPGTFNEVYLNDSTTFIETNGDLKLELNTELRFPIYKFVNGATFVDAGNIWNYRENPNFPGGKFEKDFLKEIAVSAGAGIRLDFEVLVIRVDLGIPLRKPWLPEEQRWVIDDMRFGDPKWRGENLIFNLAIGYPF